MKIRPGMNLTPYVSAVSLGVLVFLAVLLVVDRQRAPGTPYLLALLIILGSIITTRLFFHLGSELLLYMPFVVFPGLFCYSPSMYLYCETALFNRSPSKFGWISLCAAPLAALLLHTVMHLKFPEMRDAAQIATQGGIIAPYSRMLFAAAVVYNLVFLLLSLRNIRVYNKAYQENFAGADRDQLQWFKLLISLNLLLVISFCGGLVVISTFDLKIPSTPVEGIVALLMIYIILYYFIRRPAIFSLPKSAPAKASGKYQKQNLTDAERKVYLEKIENYLAEEKPFLDDKVTLAALARELGIPSHHFSMVINIERNTNFYHFINAYRVEEAKALLIREDMHDETVLDIGLMAGFQSKAGFNKVFKEITGQTPSEYRTRQKTT
ncbi:MAG: helix-turn-helix domain-containing protein [Mesorhizobium sp.]